MSSPISISGIPFSFVHDGPAASWSISGDCVAATAPPKSDLFLDPRKPFGDTDALPDAPKLLGVPPSGDFQLTARVTVGFKGMFDAGVLIVHRNKETWGKLCFEFTPQGQPSAVSVVTRGRSDDCNHFLVDGNTIWFRITRSGGSWYFHASVEKLDGAPEDARWWSMLRLFTLGDAGEGETDRVGFEVQAPTGPGCEVTFENIRYTQGAPSQNDLRNGK
ncbi:DUF1349-domain-containing protein [Gonapodya prolifera JEL478]|uniref:DUF1349-domain-containing protein n=1 Tax=Gonapodya prolifera (strain JEL478) TaxID=1344416 RepID=A0A139A5L4_GONPJ|nr:DUF1349-domain-containing protein [Gonapodya prolifera JEL478]|eukprot:KXS11929.1 DUF1349-domain-containing protein [Gonapodya prolifera JEL478]